MISELSLNKGLIYVYSFTMGNRVVYYSNLQDIQVSYPTERYDRINIPALEIECSITNPNRGVLRHEIELNREQGAENRF